MRSITTAIYSQAHTHIFFVPHLKWNFVKSRLNTEINAQNQLVSQFYKNLELLVLVITGYTSWKKYTGS